MPTILRRAESVLLCVGSMYLTLWLLIVSERAWFQWRYRAVESISAPTAPASLREAPGRGVSIARIEIPNVGVSAAILDGVESRTLRRGVGHVPGTSYPGGSGGRIVLAAHRDTFFRNLRFVRPGDKVSLIAPGGTAVYSIERIEVVAPHRTEVIQPVQDDVLTLVTCYPFTYLGDAPERFVVQARRVGSRAVRGEKTN